MSKIYKGHELLKAIENREIENGTKIEIKGRFSGDLIGSYFIYNEGAFEYNIYTPKNKIYEELSIRDILDYKFKILENEIDIDNIENLLKIEEYEVDKTDIVINRNKINELIQAVKQLDKK